MDEYATWIQASLEQVDPAKAARQKALQEHITAPFQLKEEWKKKTPLKIRA